MHCTIDHTIQIGFRYGYNLHSLSLENFLQQIRSLRAYVCLNLGAY